MINRNSSMFMKVCHHIFCQLTLYLKVNQNTKTTLLNRLTVLLLRTHFSTFHPSSFPHPAIILPYQILAVGVGGFYPKGFSPSLFAFSFIFIYVNAWNIFKCNVQKANSLHSAWTLHTIPRVWTAFFYSCCSTACVLSSFRSLSRWPFRKRASSPDCRSASPYHFLSQLDETPPAIG